MHRSMHVSCANLKKHFAEQFLEANHPQVPQCPGFHLAGRLLDSRIRIRYLIFAPTRVLLPGWSNNSELSVLYIALQCVQQLSQP